MPSNPEKFNVFLTDEIMREAACKAAKQGIKLLDASPNADSTSATLRDLGTFIDGCAEAMFWPDDNGSSVPDFDDD